MTTFSEIMTFIIVWYVYYCIEMDVIISVLCVCESLKNRKKNAAISVIIVMSQKFALISHTVSDGHFSPTSSWADCLPFWRRRRPPQKENWGQPAGGRRNPETKVQAGADWGAHPEIQAGEGESATHLVHFNSSRKLQPNLFYIDMNKTQTVNGRSERRIDLSSMIFFSSKSKYPTALSCRFYYKVFIFPFFQRERQVLKEEAQELTEKLDQEWKSIQSLMVKKTPKAESADKPEDKPKVGICWQTDE